MIPVQRRFFLSLGLILIFAHIASALPIGTYAWSDADWAQRCQKIRTSYNPDHPLSTTTLTLPVDDPRFTDFLYWAWMNQIPEHQVEPLGGEGWEGPSDGVIFHWAPGSRWEMHTVLAFGATIGHVVGEHGWQDTQFPDFFASRGGTYGVNLKDRLVELDPTSPKPWVDFLQFLGDPDGFYYRYIFHKWIGIDAHRKRVLVLSGDGVAFEYTFERALAELHEVLTDCKAYQFFQLYDLKGHGFASTGGWAGNRIPPAMQPHFANGQQPPRSASTATSTSPNPDQIAAQRARVAASEAAQRGQRIYDAQCAACHGLHGDGKGILAADGVMSPQPRDFTSGLFKFRSTPSGTLPTDDDLYRVISQGVTGSTMPAWSQFLTEAQRRDAVHYLKTFVAELDTEEPGKPITVGTPLPSTSHSIAQGRQLYTAAGCDQCHGAGGSGDGRSAHELTDDWGFATHPANLTNKWGFKGGYTPSQLYQTLRTGLDGTPMPVLDDAFSSEETWHLVNYVLSLSPDKRPVALKRTSRK